MTKPNHAQLRSTVGPHVVAFVESFVQDALAANAAAIAELSQALAKEAKRATAAEAELEAALNRERSRYEADDRLTLTREKVLMWLERNGYR